MAPRTCPFCKKRRVHHKATICPYCRSKIEPISFWKTGRGIILILLGIIFGISQLGKLVLNPIINRSQTQQNTLSNSRNLENDIGKTLFSKKTGEEIGKIVGVHHVPINESNNFRIPAHSVYKVNCEGNIVLYPSEGYLVRDVPSTKAKDTKPIVGKVDDSLKEIASEFCSRLARNDGQLQCMYLKEGCIIVEWSSEECDYCRSEILDFVLSINRIYVDHPNSINLNAIHSIDFARTCKSYTRNFNISGITLRNYLAGHPEFNDDKLLKGIDNEWPSENLITDDSKTKQITDARKKYNVFVNHWSSTDWQEQYNPNTDKFHFSFWTKLDITVKNNNSDFKLKYLTIRVNIKHPPGTDGNSISWGRLTIDVNDIEPGKSKDMIIYYPGDLSKVTTMQDVYVTIETDIPKENYKFFKELK